MCGQTSVSGDFPPAFITVSEDDRIVNAETVEQRVRDLKKAAVEVEFHKYKNVGHGFGLGVGTEAEGWIGQAVFDGRRAPQLQPLTGMLE